MRRVHWSVIASTALLVVSSQCFAQVVGGSTATQIHVAIEAPLINATVMGSVTISGWAVSDSTAISSVSLAIDSVPFGTTHYGSSRPDVCQIFPNRAGCPNVGWSIPFDTTRLPNGIHEIDVTVTPATGESYTLASNFVVANWSESNPMKMFIDYPSSGATLSGNVVLHGWAVNSQTSVASISLSVDGIPFAGATYGTNRQDVCNVYPNAAGCPNVGWSAALNAGLLSEGLHTLAVTATASSGDKSTISTNFNVQNFAANPIRISLEQPNNSSGSFSGLVGFYGWAASTSVPINNVSISIDGFLFSSATYGVSRPDVCKVFPGALNCPSVGWQQLVDTTQFVNGTHVFALTATTAAGQRTTQTTLFNVNNAVSANPISIYTDFPGYQSSILADSASFHGWALSSSSAINTIFVSIDNQPYGPVTYGSSRPDVCAIYGSANCPNVGWTLPFDTTQLANGVHVITVTVFDSSGHQGTSSGSFTVANWSSANPMVLFIDSPSLQNGSLSGTVPVQGWAIDSIAPIAQVAISVDGLPYNNANLGQTRTDVCNLFPQSVGCPNVGWSGELDTTLFPDGTHSLSITGTTNQGQSTTYSTDIQIGNAGVTPIQVYVDNPVVMQGVTGTIPVSGWAFSNDGTPLQSVQILVDGVLQGSANYGQSRPDVCVVFPKGYGCPNVGWSFSLDTTGFSNGAHSIDVKVLNTSGRQFTYGRIAVVAN